MPILVILFCSLILCGCVAKKKEEEKSISSLSPPPPPGINVLKPQQDALSLNIINNIENDYFYDNRNKCDTRLSVNNIYVEYYYGTFDGYVVATIVCHDNFGYHDQSLKDTIIGDVLFFYTDVHDIVAWKEGLFYDLQDLYDQRVLARKILKAVADFSNSRFFPYNGSQR